MGFLVLEKGTDKLHRNVSNKVPTNASEHPRRAKISFQNLNSLNRASWYIYVRKTNKMHAFSR